MVAPDECIGTHVCDKLNVPHPGVAQYQQKTVQLLPFSIFIHRVLLKKSPVHLPLFSRHCFKPHRRLFIQIHFSASHVFLDNTVFPFKTLLLEFLQYPDCRVRRFLQPLIHLLLVRIQLCRFWHRQCVLRTLRRFCVPFRCPWVYVVFSP